MPNIRRRIVAIVRFILYSGNADSARAANTYVLEYVNVFSSESFKKSQVLVRYNWLN